MREATEKDIENHLRLTNPWWEDADRAKSRFPKRRAFFMPLWDLYRDPDFRRAAILMGPRRVGKSVLLGQVIEDLVLKEQVNPKTILFVSLDNPVLNGIYLEKLLLLFTSLYSHKSTAKLYVIFDEIQYLKGWEIHLKALVDQFPAIDFIASGSAAAALKMKSQESGAGRFYDMLLPPLTFQEYCNFRDVDVLGALEQMPFDAAVKIINEHFVTYINYGGFPEYVGRDSSPDRLFRDTVSHIVDSVLLRDLPSLYGISDPQELNRLFTALAFNTGGEMTLEALSQKSNITKNTIKRYLDFLEAAFLIKRLYRVDQSGKSFKRQTHFKVYLRNLAVRTALYGPVDPDHSDFGHLVETAVCNHFLSVLNTSYARWKDGEIDFVWSFTENHREIWAGLEVKWSNKNFEKTQNNFSVFFDEKYTAPSMYYNMFRSSTISSISVRDKINKNKSVIHIEPASMICWRFGQYTSVLEAFRHLGATSRK